MVKRFLIGALSTAVLLFGITFISFFVIHLAPGGPDSRGDLNPKMTAQAREKMRSLYDLDKPLVTQFSLWAGRIVRFDFGTSFTDGEKVTVKIGRAVPVTLLLNGLTLLVIFGLGIPLGAFGALKAGTPSDKIVSGLTLAGYSIPLPWIALMLMSYFAVHLRWLPVSGLHSLFYEEMGGLERQWDLARHLVLPVAVASLTGLAGISRYMRMSLSDALRQNYIRTARAKGLSEPRILFNHALRNALLPVVTILGLSIPGLLGGSVIFETIFSIPGMGRLFYQSVFTRDYPVIMGILVLGAFLTVLGNRLADACYTLADPRIRRNG